MRIYIYICKVYTSSDTVIPKCIEYGIGQYQQKGRAAQTFEFWHIFLSTCDPIHQEIVKFLKDFDASHKTVRLIVVV